MKILKSLWGSLFLATQLSITTPVILTTSTAILSTQEAHAGFGKVRQFKKVASASIENITLNLSLVPDSGNLLVAGHWTGSNHSAGVTSTGWTVQTTATNTTDTDEITLSWKIAGASEDTTVTAQCLNGADPPVGTAAETFLMVYEFEGPFNSSPVDIDFAGSRTTGTTYTISPTDTPTYARQVVVTLVGQRYQSGFTNNQWTNGFQQYAAGTAAGTKGGSMAYREIDSTNAVSTVVTLTGSSSEASIGLMTSFKADTSVTTAPTPSDGYWVERAQPDSNKAIQDVVPDPTNSSDYSGSTGFSSITDAWNGAIVRRDTAGTMVQYWISRAGGHYDYYGNEDYSLDLLDSTAAWTRIGDPTSSFADMDLDILTTGIDALGKPKAAHTYNTHSYSYDADMLVFFGARHLSVVSPDEPPGTREVSRKALTTSTTTWINDWTDLPNSGGSRHHAHYIGNGIFIIVDSQAGASAYYTYNSNTDTYTTYTLEGLTIDSPVGCSAWDSKRGKMFVAGIDSGYIALFNPGTGGGERIDVPTPPEGLDISGQAVGVAYDTYLDKYTFWHGGDSLYHLDPINFTWTVREIPAQTVTPTEPIGFGTFNRFQYIPPISGTFPEGAYVILNGTDESTYMFYPTTGGGGGGGDPEEGGSSPSGSSTNTRKLGGLGDLGDL